MGWEVGLTDASPGELVPLEDELVITIGEARAGDAGVLLIMRGATLRTLTTGDVNLTFGWTVGATTAAGFSDPWAKRT